MRNGFEDRRISGDFEKMMKTCCCIAAGRRVCSAFSPAVSIIVHKQSSQ